MSGRLASLNMLTHSEHTLQKSEPAAHMIGTEENARGRSMPTMINTLELQLPAHTTTRSYPLCLEYHPLTTRLPTTRSIIPGAPHLPRFTLPHIASDLPTAHIIRSSFFFQRKPAAYILGEEKDPALNICTSDSMAHENSLS